MKALVLAGGTGARLRPFTHSMPKQLMPVANMPVLAYVLGNIRDMAVTDVGVIVGDRGTEIAEALGDGSRFGLDLTYIPQEDPLGLAHCVMIARDFLGDDDFVMFLGDNMFGRDVAAAADEFRSARPAAHVVVTKVQNPSEFGVAELDQDGAVLRFEEKPRNPRSDLALTGVYFFTPAIHAAVGAIKPSARGELEITDAIQWLVTQGIEVRASEYGGYWKDTGRVEDLLDCNREILEGLPLCVAGEVDEASVLVGRVVVEAGARVVRSRIEGPAIVGADSLVEDSQVGPHTSIGRGCVLRDSRLSGSIVLDGATISEVRGLSASLIGRSSTVGGAESNRLVVGDHSRVEVVA